MRGRIVWPPLNSHPDAGMLLWGFCQSNSDPCIYYKGSGEEIFYMGVYVDDIILAGKTESKLEQEKKALANKFNIKL